jgi:hypothetical protein
MSRYEKRNAEFCNKLRSPHYIPKAQSPHVATNFGTTSRVGGPCFLFDQSRMAFGGLTRHSLAALRGLSWPRSSDQSGQ